MVSSHQGEVCNWRQLDSNKETWPRQWWRSGQHFEVTMSKWFRFEEAFIYAFMCVFIFKKTNYILNGKKLLNFLLFA